VKMLECAQDTSWFLPQLDAFSGCYITTGDVSDGLETGVLVDLHGPFIWNLCIWSKHAPPLRKADQIRNGKSLIDPCVGKFEEKTSHSMGSIKDRHP
jgi:hypothetical protein